MFNVSIEEDKVVKDIFIEQPREGEEMWSASRVQEAAGQRRIQGSLQRGEFMLRRRAGQRRLPLVKGGAVEGGGNGAGTLWQHLVGPWKVVRGRHTTGSCGEKGTAIYGRG